MGREAPVFGLKSLLGVQGSLCVGPFLPRVELTTEDRSRRGGVGVSGGGSTSVLTPIT